jgi:hypothetical protein
MVMAAKVKFWPDCRRDKPLGAGGAGIVRVRVDWPIVGQKDVGRPGIRCRRDFLRSVVGQFLSADFSASAMRQDYLSRGLREILFFRLALDPR